MRVASGTAATAGAPPAVASSGSRGVLTRRVWHLPPYDAGRRRHLQQRVVAVDVAALRPDLRARDDAPPAPPLDVGEAAERDARTRLRLRQRERRPAEEPPPAAAQAVEAGVPTAAHDPPGTAGGVEELDADAQELRRVRSVRHRHAHADGPRRAGRIACVDGRPRRARLRLRRRGQDEQDDDDGRDGPKARRGHARHRIEQVAAEKPAGSAPGVSGWPAPVRRRTRRTTVSSRRQSNVTSPRSAKTGAPAAGGMIVKVRPAWRTRASPWPRSRNPESAARPRRTHVPSSRRNCTWMRMNSSSRRSSVPGIEPRMAMPSGWPTVSHTFTVAHGWASRTASAGSCGGAATLAAGRATRSAALAATASARMPDRMTTPVQHRDRRPGFGPEPPVAPWSRDSSAGGLVRGRLVLGEVVLRQRHEAGADVRLRRLAGQGRVGLLDALRPDVGRLLGDQRLAGSRLQVGDLLRARVEADDLHLVPLARLLDAGGGALGGEQVRGEDALEVRVLGEHGLRDRRRLRGVVVVELLAEVRQPRGLRTLLEALRAGVGRRDARLDVVDEDLPRAADELRERLRRLLAAALVVARDLGHRELRLVERGVDED